MRAALFMAGLFATGTFTLAANPSVAFVLEPAAFRHHIELFNRMLPEEVVNDVPDARAWDWIERNVPLFACPDREVEQMYYYRWWAYRKHITQTPAGFIVTEFL
jgi:hypothetical protein